LVWQNTTHVGCGITNCTGNYGFPYGLSVVCNYGPGGNYEGRFPYEAKSQDECYAVTTRRPKPTRRPVTTKRPKTTRRPSTTKRPRTTRRPETTRRPITTKHPETIPTRKPDISKQIPKPNWPTLISSWSGFANSNMLQGIITKTYSKCDDCQNGNSIPISLLYNKYNDKLINIIYSMFSVMVNYSGDDLNPTSVVTCEPVCSVYWITQQHRQSESSEIIDGTGDAYNT
ncbi:unnamed protein product, partial [Schistosoma curassoni]|uniref:SCP domain-containing protein n=1 Tax=Schistosoma curassoni TaxID=6186 RepID=A0A183KN18_9TREM